MVNPEAIVVADFDIHPSTVLTSFHTSSPDTTGVFAAVELTSSAKRDHRRPSRGCLGHALVCY